MLNVGDKLDGGRYTILQKLGQGGAGSVYRVSDERSPTRYALKQFSIGEVLDEEERAAAVAGFRSEVSLLMSLNHPNITQIVNYFIEDDSYYIVMDLVDGQNLNKALKEAGGHPPLATVLDWFWQVVDVLVYLHRHVPPIIFRDLKPGNIMVTRTGVIKLIDFGIARFFKHDGSGDTRALGTPGYAPPEQYGRSQTDVRSDIYALGVTFWQLLTGADPTEHIFDLPPARALNPALPVALDQLLALMTRMEPSDRLQSISAVRDRLKLIYPSPIHPSPPETLLALTDPLASPSNPPLAAAVRVEARQPATTTRIDARYLEPTPLPAVGEARKQQRQEPSPRSEPALQAVPPDPRPVVGSRVAGKQSPTPLAGQSVRKGRGPLIPTFVIALLLVGGLAFALVAGYLQLPVVGSTTPTRPTIASSGPAYPNTVPPPPGVTKPSYNSRSRPGDWSQVGYDWGRTNYSREANVLPSGAQLWSYPIPLTASFSLPLIAEGSLYLVAPDMGGITAVVALSAETGAPLWSFQTEYDPANPSPLAYAAGDQGQPRLFYAGDNALVALDPRNAGRRLWAKDRLGAGGTISSTIRPIAVNGVVYLLSAEAEGLLDAASGDELASEVRAGTQYEASIVASPDAASTYAIICGLTTCSLEARATSPQRANPLWSVAAKRGSLLNTADSVYLASDDASIQAYDARDGSALWNSGLAGGAVQMAVKDNILVASTSQLTALRTADGTQIWSYPLAGGQTVGAPIIVGEVVYAAVGDGRSGGSILALDLKRGTLLKQYPTSGVPRSGPLYASRTLYYVDEQGLHALH